MNIRDENLTNNEIITIDSVENAINSLESILLFLEWESNMKWKWIILALHHSLYLFCIANLEGGNYQQVLTGSFYPDENLFFKRGENQWKKSLIVKSKNIPLYRIEWEEIDYEPQFNLKATKRRNPKLLNFWSAIARVLDSEVFMKRFSMSKPLIISNDEEKDVVNLCKLRNEFVHFVPQLLGIAIKDLKNITTSITNIILRLSVNTKQINFRYKSDKDRITKVCKEIILHLQ
jgi:hypothetical protein